MYVEISSVSSVLLGILGVLPVLAYPPAWIDRSDTIDGRIEIAIKTGAEAIKKEIIQLAKQLFGDEFPKTDYIAYHGNQPVIIESAGLKLMPRIDYGVDDEVNMATDTLFYPPHTLNKHLALILLHNGVYLVEEIFVKLPGRRKCDEYFPELGNTKELSATMYCALGKSIIACMRQAIENRKLRKEIDAAAAQTSAS